MADQNTQFGKSAMDLTTGPIFRTLVMFSLPALATNVLQSINGFINAIWIGQFLGERGLAATANANLIMFMMIALVFGFGMASSIVIGQNAGRRDIDGMRRAFGTGLGLFLAMGFAAGVLGWFLSPIILRTLGTPDDVYPLAKTYLQVMFLGLPFTLVSVYLSMSLRAIGDSITPLLLGLPGIFVDILLNPVLIQGLGPAPRLGIMGSGIATLVAGLVSVAALTFVIYRRDLPIRLRGAEFRYIKPVKEIVAIIVSKGVPMGLQMIVMSVSGLTLIGFVNAQGTDTVAAYGAANQLWTYIQMPPIAIAMAVSAMAAQNIGAKRWDRLGEIARAGVIINLCLTGALVLSTLVFDRAALRLFLPHDAGAIEIGRHIGMIASWSFILMGASMVLSGIMRANGAALAPLIFMIIAYLPGRLGAIYVLRPWLGVDAVWWSFPVGAVLSLVLTLAYYVFGPWRKGSMIATTEEAEEFVQSTADPAGRMLPNE